MKKQLVLFALALLLVFPDLSLGQEVKQIYLGTLPAAGSSRQGGLLVCFEIGGVVPLGLENPDQALTLRASTLAQSFNTPVLSAQLADLLVFPNPAQRWVKVSFPTDIKCERGVLTLYNLLGQPVRELRIEAENEELRLFVGDLAHGIYVARLTDASGQPMAAARVVVSRR